MLLLLELLYMLELLLFIAAIRALLRVANGVNENNNIIDPIISLFTFIGLLG
jgi:hypothetical protein